MSGAGAIHTGVVGTAVVSDLEAAVAWYTTALGREPDSRPMEGLAQWDITGTAHLQLLADPDRAGRSVVVVNVTDVEARAGRAREAGLEVGTVDPAGEVARTCTLTDPDGNELVLAQLVGQP